MHGKCHDARLVGEENGIAVALMHVTVDNEDAFNRVGIVPKYNICCHCDVGKDTESFAIVVEGVMRSTSNVATEDVRASADGMCCCDSAADRRQGALDASRAPREADVPVLALGEHIAQESLDVLGAVRGSKVGAAHQRGGFELDVCGGLLVPLDPFAHDLVLAHRKSVLFWQLYMINIIVE